MFVPRVYREPDVDWIIELMRRNPLALLMTNGDDAEGPYGTHLPIIPGPDVAAGGLTDLTGASLIGHMNRANPQWGSLRDGMSGVLSFTGPHSYVSPTLYGITPAAPTWNFTAAQVRGVIHRIEPGEDTLAVVRATVRIFEAEFGHGWDMSESIDYFRKIVPAVGAFHFTIVRAEAMFKLSQEQSSEARGRVCRHFAQEGSPRQKETAEYMSRLTGPAAEPAGVPVE